jgi:DNA-binding LytR/AlgR family response regulator
LWVFLWFFRVDYQFKNTLASVTYLIGFIVFILSSVAFVFYIRYVGSVTITFYIVFKVVLICIAPLVIIRIYEVQRDLVQTNEQLILNIKKLQNQVDKFEDDNLNKSIEFISDNNSENLILQISEIAFIKSANNYVEVVYKDDSDNLKKKLVRNTLRNIELQLNEFSNFIRCHRICIVNKFYIEHLNRNYSSHWLTIKGYPEQIPVSRQYLLRVKESI